jgi:hypothetical protein
MQHPRGPRRGSDAAKLIATVFLIGVLVALALPAFQPRRGGPHRSPCKNNLKQIGLALHNYHDIYGSFPPAIVYGPDGKPWHSWRTLLLPYLEHGDILRRYRFDEPWDGPNNRKLAGEAGTLSVFHCPSDEDAAPGTTSYLAVIGDETMWPPHGAGTFDDAIDGKGRTLHVVEVANSGVHWMEPKDLRLATMSFQVGAAGEAIRGPHGGTKRWFRKDDPSFANASFVDDSVRVLSSETPPETVRSLLIRDDGGPSEF